MFFFEIARSWFIETNNDSMPLNVFHKTVIRILHKSTFDVFRDFSIAVYNYEIYKMNLPTGRKSGPACKMSPPETKNDNDIRYSYMHKQFDI